MSRSREDWSSETDYLIYGCITHCFNKINEGILTLDRYYARVQDCNKLITKLRNGKLGQFLKKKILRKRCNDEMTRRFPELATNSIQYKIEFDQMFESKEMNDRAGIPQPGETRKWNNMYELMNFCMVWEMEIRQLYVICCFHAFFVFNASDKCD